MLAKGMSINKPPVAAVTGRLMNGLVLKVLFGGMNETRLHHRVRVKVITCSRARELEKFRLHSKQRILEEIALRRLVRQCDLTMMLESG